MILTIAMFSGSVPIPVPRSERGSRLNWKVEGFIAFYDLNYRDVLKICTDFRPFFSASLETQLKSWRFPCLLWSYLSRCSRDLSRSLSLRLCDSRSRFLSSSLLPYSLSSSGLSLPCLPSAPGKPSPPRNPGGNPRPIPGSQGMPGGGPIIGWNGWLGSASNHNNGAWCWGYNTHPGAHSALKCI